MINVVDYYYFCFAIHWLCITVVVWIQIYICLRNICKIEIYIFHRKWFWLYCLGFVLLYGTKDLIQSIFVLFDNCTGYRHYWHWLLFAFLFVHGGQFCTPPPPRIFLFLICSRQSPSYWYTYLQIMPCWYDIQKLGLPDTKPWINLLN